MLCFFACPSCKIWIFLYNKIGGVWNERCIFLQERRDAQVQVRTDRSCLSQRNAALSKGNCEIINNVYKERKQP